jgi:hypothetical protein
MSRGTQRWKGSVAPSDIYENPLYLGSVLRDPDTGEPAAEPYLSEMSKLPIPARAVGYQNGLRIDLRPERHEVEHPPFVHEDQIQALLGLSDLEDFPVQDLIDVPKEYQV